jgi:osmoprotectant transport system ATP-binding protein
MLELRAASKRFGAHQALREVSLKLRGGETGVLVGLSGSGKSTVLRLLLGLLEADTGEVCFAGRRVTPEDVLTIRRRTGYVIQDGGLFAHLDAYGNVALMPRYLGWSKQDTRARIDALCQLMRLPRERLSSYPVQLSGGERQRVSVMRALVLDPDVLLLDEPFGALDPMTRAELQHDLRAIFRELRKTVVLVTHDLQEAAYFGDFLALMRDGAIVQQGSFEDLRQRPRDDFVRRFVSAQVDALVPTREAGE